MKVDGNSILAAAGVQAPTHGRVIVQRVPSGNLVFRLSTDRGAFYVKAPTKDLGEWSIEVEGARTKAIREAAAAECLRRRSLAAMEVLAVETGVANALGRPYLLTREVRGRPFTEVAASASASTLAEALSAVGAYLRSVHSIEFSAAGYLVSADGPIGPTPPAPVRPSHTPEAAQAAAYQDLAKTARSLDAGLRREVARRLSSIADGLRNEFHPPHFVIGGFHPNHPYLDHEAGGWTVVGCIDLEVASGGRVLDDLVTFATGIMTRVDAEVPWWEPLFDGYGSEPSIESVRVELLASCSYLFGEAPDLDATYRALLAAPTWSKLFNAHRCRRAG